MANQFVKFDMKKFQKDLERKFKETAVNLLKDMTQSEKTEIANATIVEIQNTVSKGISPIAGKGRFPGYKWVEASNALAKKARAADKKSIKRKALQAAAKIAKKNKYPYSVQRKFPGKKERPVNLYLSGKFLDHLAFKTRSFGFAIGFYDDLSELKERGHREGANGQPQRPIIPIKGEEFSSSIYRRIVDTVTKVLRKKIKT